MFRSRESVHFQSLFPPIGWFSARQCQKAQQEWKPLLGDGICMGIIMDFNTWKWLWYWFYKLCISRALFVSSTLKYTWGKPAGLGTSLLWVYKLQVFLEQVRTYLPDRLVTSGIWCRKKEAYKVNAALVDNWLWWPCSVTSPNVRKDKRLQFHLTNLYACLIPVFISTLLQYFSIEIFSFSCFFS